ncbi:MAG: hypoxanthine phosphoribosyltransferase [Nitrospiraceae bacterium]|nr:hypoxanthine phosphoribosyltransferase [Nitrospiraceae bacterium]
MVTGKPFFTTEQIQSRVKELAEKISSDYQGKNLLAIGILKGAFMFYSDLVRMIKIPLMCDFIVASSYVKADTTGEVRVHCDIRENLADKDILLIEDIADSGITLNFVRERILSQRPKSLKTCVFLDKKEKRTVDIPLEYVGFEIPDVFVVGYGLDYDDKYRNLPYISIFKKTF